MKLSFRHIIARSLSIDLVFCLVGCAGEIIAVHPPTANDYESKLQRRTAMSKIRYAFVKDEEAITEDDIVDDGSWIMSQWPRQVGIADLRRRWVTIYATLYTEDLVEAEIRHICKKDSLSFGDCEEARMAYFKEHSWPDQFRIELKSESQSLVRVLDISYLLFYLIDSEGILYEPVEVSFKPAVSELTNVYYQEKGYVKQYELGQSGAVYFDRVTFFGKDLLDVETGSLQLVLSHNRQVVVALRWDLDK